MLWKHHGGEDPTHVNFAFKGETMKELMLRLWREEEGQDLTEYALLLVLIALAVAAVLPFFANALRTVFNNASSNLQTSTST